MDHFATYPENPLLPLAPQIAADLRARAEATPLYRMPPAESRTAFETLCAGAPKMNEPVAHSEERTLPGPEGPIGVRIYTPANSVAPASLLYIHGGGWVAGSSRSHDDLCRSLCHRAAATVVSVDYRLSPEHKYPAALHDCYAALQWLAAQPAGARLAVAGDSAGGNLGAALALYARDQGGPPLRLQVLIYPVTNRGFDTASYHECAEGYGLMRDAMRYYWDCYLGLATHGDAPYAAPLQAADLRGLPPALILTAQYDVLRDDGEAYAARLRRAGVPVRCTRYRAMHHGFLQFAASYADGRVALQEIADALRSAFASQEKS
jgi:acetyl esterase